MDDKEKEAGRLAEGNFQIVMSLTQQRNITISGYIYHGESQAERNARIDACQDLMDRQYIRCDIVNMEAQKLAMSVELKAALERYEELKAKANGTPSGLSAGKPGKSTKLISVEQQQLQHLPANLDNANKNIGILTEKIAAARAKLESPAA